MNDNIRQYLTYRYVIALSLIFCVLLITLITFTKQLSSAKSDAFIINVSGKQRMLSQRIALMAREVENAQTKADADLYAKEMSDILKTMLLNHKHLSTGIFDNGQSYRMSDAINRLYFNSGGIDQKVTEYTDYATKFLETYNDKGIKAIKQSNLADDIVKIARNNLLDALNEVVFTYEKEAKDRINKFKYTEFTAFSLGLILLILEIIFIFRPMTKTIIKTTNELKNRNDELLEFSYRISHDLRSPIKSISGLIGIAKSQNQSNKTDKLKITFTHMSDSITRLENLTEDIIRLTKMKMSDISAEEVDIEQIIDDSIKSISFTKGFNNIKIQKNVKVDSKILIKKMYLEQIIDNLLSNSVKYQDQNKENKFVNIEVKQENGNCIINVIDNGIGIDDDYKEKIFKMFQRFHPKHSFGSGLGLYLVKQNAKALDGNIEYYSLPDGSQFTLTFPFKRSK